MKYWLFLILSSVVILSWCSFWKQEKEKYTPLPEISKDSPLLQQQKNQFVDESITEEELWENQSHIVQSWDIFYYYNIFALRKVIEPSYVNTRVIYANNVKEFKWELISDKEFCTPSYQEWINYQPKITEKVLWSKKIYITYAVFDVSAPDMDPFKNYQAEICFVKDDRVYTISISDQKKYRKDIVESFRFL